MSWLWKILLFIKACLIGALFIIRQTVQWFFPALAVALVLVMALFGRELSHLRQWQLTVQKSLPVTLAQDFRVNAAIDHEFPIKLDANIPVRFPVASVVRIPIKETFLIPLDQAFPASLVTPVRLKTTVRVCARIPIDAEMETKVMGIAMTVPVKGSLPLDIQAPLDQEIQIPGEIMVMLHNPLPVSINQTVEAPLNFVVEGSMPLNTTIQAPVQGVLDCGVHAQNALPVNVELALSMDDLLAGIAPNLEGHAGILDFIQAKAATLLSRDGAKRP